MQGILCTFINSYNIMMEKGCRLRKKYTIYSLPIAKDELYLVWNFLIATALFGSLVSNLINIYVF